LNSLIVNAARGERCSVKITGAIAALETGVVRGPAL